MPVQLSARRGNVPPYTVTSEDLLWLLRAINHEGPDPRLNAAVLVNGHMWNRSQGGRGSLGSWVRNYSQPVNPHWYESGEGHQQKMREAASEAERAELVAKARRREHVFSKETKFPARIHAAVRAALAGAVPLDPRAVDFAAPWAKSSRIALEPVPKGRNRLYTRRGAETWEGYVSSAASRAPLLALLGAGLAAGAAYFAAKKGRRA